MSPWVESLASSDWGRECEGLAADELKKKDEDTDGKEETESEEGLSGALERGEEGAEALVKASGWKPRIVVALVLILSSIEMRRLTEMNNR